MEGLGSFFWIMIPKADFFSLSATFAIAQLYFNPLQGRCYCLRFIEQKLREIQTLAWL